MYTYVYISLRRKYVIYNNSETEYETISHICTHMYIFHSEENMQSIIIVRLTYFIYYRANNLAVLDYHVFEYYNNI
jgi:hypothetical protein